MINVLPFNITLSLFCPIVLSLITTTVTDINLCIQVEECLSVAWDSKFVKPRHHLPSVGSSCPLMTDLRHCVEASPHPHSWGIAPSCPAVGNKSFSPDFLWDKWKESNKKNSQDVKMLKPPNSCLFPCFVSYSLSKMLLCDQEMKLLKCSVLFSTNQQQSINATLSMTDFEITLKEKSSVWYLWS